MKKAQMRMMETIIVLFIFFIILAMSLVFFYSFNRSSTERLAKEYQEIDLYNLILEIPNLPDIKCSFLTAEEECLDSTKMLTPLKDYGKRRIEVQLIATESPLNCDLTTYPICNTFLLYNNQPQSIIVVSTPISIYYPITEEYKPGILKITQ